MCFFFFFSSRRRHTRFDCDWSSDVCSSDLASAPQQEEPEGLPGFMNLEDLPPPAAEVDRGRAVAPTMHAPPATPVFDGVTEEAAPPPAIETFDTASAAGLELDTPATSDFGT